MEKSNLPVAVVEVVEPVILGAKILDTAGGCDFGGCDCCCDVPESICGCFDESLMMADDGKRLLVSLGQFSIIKLERDIQLLMPSFDICLPDKECAGGKGCNGIDAVADPCELFASFKFPVDEFFPPRRSGAAMAGAGCNTACKR
jgi:hypothetical protein